MARIKKDKTIYQQKREGCGLTREKACDLFKGITPERLERIESGKFTAHPDEILQMAETYHAPHLCNYYCANECEIGKQYVPEIKVKDLSQIVLEMLASLNSIRRNQERMIEITADGVIDEDEIAEFVDIQEELEKISITVETLQLWIEHMISDGHIDKKAYLEAKKNKAL